MKKIEYKLASITWDQKEYDVLEQVIKFGKFTMGDNVKKCEENFAEYVKSKYCVMVNSGSSANLLMVAALQYRKSFKRKKNPLVIVPAVSWATTYYPFHQYGYRLKFVDIDLKTLNYNLVDLKNAFKEETPDILMCVNLLGNSNDFDEIKSIIGNTDTILLEDNCESMGALYKDKQCGTIGLMGTFSTFFSHHINTMEGGFVVTDDEELYHIVLSLRAHGWTRNLPDENHVSGTKSKDWFIESYNFILPGYNVRPLEMSGALGIEQIKKLPNLLKQRRKNAKYFIEKMKEIDFIQIQEETDNSNSSWFGFSLILKDSYSRKKLINLLDKHNIECRPIVAGNFFRNPVVKHMKCKKYNKLINADCVNDNGLFIGNHHFEITKEIDYLVDVLKLYK